MNSGTLLFTIPPALVATYRAWRLRADQDYLAVQLERQGYAAVVRLGNEQGLDKISTLPALGEADPWYGDIGGGFPFVFAPERHACRLTITAPPIFILSELHTGNKGQHPPVAAPLELTVAPPALLDETLATPGDHGVLDDYPADPALPWRFAIAGPMLQKLIKQGWDRYVRSAYSYTFLPTNIGCFVTVIDLKTGEKFFLNDDDLF